MTGIAAHNSDTEALQDDRIQKACKLIETMEVQGRLIYFAGDDNLNRICSNLRRDIVAFYYGLPDFEIQNDIIYLKTKKTDIPLKFSGDQNLLSLNAARLACRQIGIYDDQFLNAISDFSVPDNF
jgi:UDP-N-acetylmuramate: L-alanyl-gamma-D-glutamyl-meso-diaminopimelate ligase